MLFGYSFPLQDNEIAEFENKSRHLQKKKQMKKMLPNNIMVFTNTVLHKIYTLSLTQEHTYTYT